MKGSVDLDFFEIPGVWKHNPIHSQPRGTTCPRCEPERREKPAAPPWGMPRVNSSPLPGYLWGERDRNSCGTFRRLHPPVYGPEPRPRRRGRRRGGITTVEPPDLEPGKYLYPPSEDDKDPFDYQAGECVS